MPDSAGAFRRAAFEQPTRFDLVINLQTAKALALPQSLLQWADQLIE